MDTIVGKNGKGDILTLVERTMFFCMMQKLPKGKNAKEHSKIVYGAEIGRASCRERV